MRHKFCFYINDLLGLLALLNFSSLSASCICVGYWCESSPGVNPLYESVTEEKAVIASGAVHSSQSLPISKKGQKRKKQTAAIALALETLKSDPNIGNLNKMYKVLDSTRDDIGKEHNLFESGLAKTCDECIQNLKESYPDHNWPNKEREKSHDKKATKKAGKK